MLFSEIHTMGTNCRGNDDDAERFSSSLELLTGWLPPVIVVVVVVVVVSVVVFRILAVVEFAVLLVSVVVVAVSDKEEGG